MTEPTAPGATKTALVTGGGGFLGGAIIDRLLARGVTVRSLARGDYPALRAKGVKTLRGDLADASVVVQATAGCDVVFHVAAKAGMWGAYDSYHQANVVGTQNVIAACRDGGISRLVYTSTPSVVQRLTSIEGADESLGYPDDHSTAYQATKAEAERLVMAANGEGLATVSLRPRMIWGPGDTQIGPRLVDRHKKGRLRVVGDGSPLVDSVYIDNAADAHMCAWDALAAHDDPTQAPCAGRVYFVTNGEPWPIGKLMNAILAASDMPPVTKSVSPRVAWIAGTVIEWIWKGLRLSSEPPMTRFLARQLCTANHFDISAARRDLGYDPAVSMQEGLRRLKQSLASADLG